MNFSANPGQNKTLTIVFEDSAGGEHPLAAIPTCVDTTGVAVISPVGTQTPADPSFAWSVSVPASAVIGSSLSLDVKGVNADGVVDEETYAVLINALDDTVQVATFS